MQIGNLILRGIQLLFVVILTALLGNVIDNNIDGHMSSINFCLFVAVLAWISVGWGIVGSFITSLTEGLLGYILLGLDVLTTLFVFIAAIVLPAKLRAVNCSNSHLTVKHHSADWIGFGSNDNEKRCRELQASCAFFWFLFATLIGSSVLTFLGVRRLGGGSSGRSSAPHMSQVRV